MKKTVLLLTMGLLITNINQSHSAAVEVDSTYRRGPSLCARMAMWGATIFAINATGSEAATPSLRSHNTLEPADLRFSSSGATVKRDVYIKGMVDPMNGAKILKQIRPEGEDYAEHQGSVLLNAAQLHMTMEHLEVHHFDIRNKKFINAACNAWFAIKNKKFEITDASKDFGRWMVLLIDPEIHTVGIPDHPHVSIFRDGDEEVRERFMKLYFDWKKLLSQKITFNRVAIGPHGQEVEVSDNECQHVAED